MKPYTRTSSNAASDMPMGTRALHCRINEVRPGLSCMAYLLPNERSRPEALPRPVPHAGDQIVLADELVIERREHVQADQTRQDVCVAEMQLGEVVHERIRRGVGMLIARNVGAFRMRMIT